MAAVWFRARAELRSRWRAWLGLALLLGLAGGAVMAAAAGARRTASAFPRLQEATAAFDVLVNPDTGAMDFDAVEALPQVAQATRGSGVLVLPVGPGGEPDFSFDTFVPFASPDEGFAYELNRLRMDDGRMPDPDRVDEAVLDTGMAADLGIEVGDQLDLVSFTEEEAAPFMEAESSGPPPQGTPVTVRIVGLGTAPSDVVVAERDRLPALGLTPAFVRELDPAPIFTASVIRLRNGTADTDAFIAGAEAIAGEELVFYQTRRELEAKAASAVRPEWGALAVFALVAGAATMLVVGQAVGRQLFLDARDNPTLRAVGLSRRQLVTVSLLRVGAAAVVGALVAVALAVALSPLAPIGLAAEVEGDPGVHADWAVLGVGVAAMVLLTLGAAAWPAWRAARSAIGPSGSGPVARPSKLAGAVATTGLSPTATAGVRLALEPGQGRTAVPVRATLVGAALSVTALVAALTFAASLDRFLATPRLYGGDWDATVELGALSEDEGHLMEQAAGLLDATPGVAATAVGGQGQATVGGVPVAAIGIEPGPGSLHPTLLEGRPPLAADEVLLGSRTLRRTGHDVGDTVEVEAGEDVVPMQVVGRAVFPRFSAYSGADKTGLGDGAAFTFEGLEAVSPGAYPSLFLVRFEPGAEPEQVLALIRDRLAPVDEGLEGDPMVIGAPEQPDDILGYERVDAVPLALAGLLLVLAGGTTAHALVTSVRRRRRDLALLKTLGFVRRQVSATVAWQSTTLAVVALLVGLPLGVAAGRATWALLAERLDAVAQPVVPVAAVLVLVPLVLAAANLVAALPARSAARTEPAITLREE